MAGKRWFLPIGLLQTESVANRIEPNQTVGVYAMVQQDADKMQTR